MTTYGTHIIGGSVPDHRQALHSLGLLRLELARMTFRTATGEQHSNEDVARRMLDTIESLIVQHQKYQEMEAHRIPPLLTDSLKNFKPEGWA